MIGLAILCYEGYKDLVMSLTALKQNTVAPPGEQVEFIVFDNSEKTTDIAKYIRTEHPDVVYHKPIANVGCTASRNTIYHEMLERHPDAKYLVVLDQDIEVRKNWLVDMWEVAQQYDDCGVVAWPQAYRLKASPVDGVVSEVASMCNFHTIDPLKKVEEKWGGPFDERFFFHKFDSLICQRLNQIGYRTRLVMKYYKQGVRWEHQQGGIIHHHPHQGVRRHPKCKKIIARSKRLFKQLQRTEGWSLWYPEGAVVKPTSRRPRARAVRATQPTSALPKAPPPPPPPKVRKTLKQLLKERKSR